ncbi:MAG: DUF4159 domain-containing protein [Rhodobacterales bacterium]|nr:DUF4159 domain-containing protein [Rhodobacterales bacterium]
MTSRRQLLTSMGALCVTPSALAFGDTTRIDIGQLNLGRGSGSRPNAWKRLLHEVKQTTSVETEARAPTVDPASPALFEHPFCVLVGEGGFDDPSDEAVEQLARFLSYGGFLLVDDTSGSDDSPFDASVRKLIRRLFPTKSLGQLPRDHSLYRSFFLLDQPLGRVDRFDHLEAVTVGNLAPLVYCRNDLSGALDRGDDGRPRHACIPGGSAQRHEAVKLGINLVLYSLTANYKKDQAHVKELMRMRRIE